LTYLSSPGGVDQQTLSPETNLAFASMEKAVSAMFIPQLKAASNFTQNA